MSTGISLFYAQNITDDPKIYWKNQIQNYLARQTWTYFWKRNKY